MDIWIIVVGVVLFHALVVGLGILAIVKISGRLRGHTPRRHRNGPGSAGMG